MGEYANRLSDGSHVKIGTCEDMFYLRFEDRDKVSKVANSLDPRMADGLRFRLPFPDEDNVHIGQYDPPERGQRLYRDNDNFTPSWCDSAKPGIIQLTHKCGYLLNVPCYHGAKLPDLGPETKAFWNGRSWFYELSSLRVVKQEDGKLKVFPVVNCRHCGKAWRFEWSDVLEFIPQPLRARLEHYQTDTF